MTPDVQKLLDTLVARDVISAETLEIRKGQFQTLIRDIGLARALVTVYNIPEDAIVDAICAAFHYPRMSIASEIDSAPGQILSEEEMNKFRVIPVFRIGLELNIAFIDIPTKEIITQLQKLSGCRILPVISTILDYEAAFRKYTGAVDRVQQIASTLKLEKFDIRVSGSHEAMKLVDGFSETNLAQLVDEIFLRAAKTGASDIHIEPMEEEILVRFRIDGVLQRILSLPKAVHLGLMSVIKSKCSMDMFERNIPQDGRLTLTYGDRVFDVRVNTLPLIEGEKAVLRLLSKSSAMIDIDNLGFSKHNVEVFRSLLRLPNGIILVTGPTGSGKTTTLYSALNEIKSMTRNITTVENPVEYKLPLVNQVQVATERGLTFGSALRAILRQDPNIILIGEIRDAETGMIATEAALTGHLVLSTLHTNDAFGAISRMINLGIASFWVSASVIGVMAQRLVRRICSRCKEEYEPSEQELLMNGLSGLPAGTKLFRGHGCSFCSGTGYKGRIALHEVFMVNEDMREVIHGEITTRKLKNLAIANNFKDMYFDGLQKAIAGITTTEEVNRVTRRIV